MRTTLAGLIVLLVSLPSGWAEETRPSRESPKTPPSIWERVFVMGASASAGFRTKSEAGRVVNLAAVLDEAIRAEHGKIESAASTLFFIQPMLAGQTNVKLAKKVDPTLIVAVDFLFWFGYGTKSNEEQRLTDLEKGLAYLDEFRCPVVVSRIPDMREAIGKMLSRRQVPRPATIEKLNARIDEWAKTRNHVAVVPMVKFVNRVKEGKKVEVAESSYPEGSLRRLIQRDDLHPTVEGLSAIAVLALEALAQADDRVSTKDYERNASRLAKRLLRKAEKAAARGESK